MLPASIPGITPVLQIKNINAIKNNTIVKKVQVLSTIIFRIGFEVDDLIRLLRFILTRASISAEDNPVL